MSELDTGNLSTVDLVCHMDTMLDYQTALKAIQEAAEELGCGFVNDGGSVGDTMLPQIKECLTMALAEWHVRSRYPKDGHGWASRLRVLIESGYAEARLNRMLAALDACGFVFRIGDDASLKTLVRFVDLISENDPANYPPPLPIPEPPSIKLHVS